MADTVIATLDDTARRHASRPALARREASGWATATWAEYRTAVRCTARGLLRLGVEPGDGVAILAANRPEWFVANLAAIATGALPAGIYTTSTPEQCRYVADHCRARVVLVENVEQLAKLLAVRASLPRLRELVLLEGEAEAPDARTWKELQELGREPLALLDERIALQSADDACTLIYTSGTTGRPKAVTLTHRNLTWTARRLVEAYRFGPADRIVSYLPLAHIAEQIVSLHSPMAAGGSSWIAPSMDSLPAALREVRPHIFLGVPRVWEKLQARIEAGLGRAGPLRRWLVGWARAVGRASGEAARHGTRPPLLRPVADRLVFRPLRRRLGFDRARICVTSAAPISRETLGFFESLGLPLLEVYGMSECSGPATLSLPGAYRLGLAGRAIEGGEIRVAEDGEILIRGPHVFLGYYRDPEATREALDADGWLHSGDIGAVDADGYLRVTDRKKDLLITSGGKNIAPQALEGKLKAIPAVSQAVAVGDGRRFVAALLTLDPDRLPAATAAAGSPARSPAEARLCPRFRAYLERQVEAVNATLARFETIKRFAILPRELSVAAGELTSTLKLKRRVIAERYAAEIEALFRPPSRTTSCDPG